ncbi:MAG: hypothetical protein BMS9Abin31_0009 [Gammaproteobacteria bacterium]|nr:MAG: hypothetical protein BMS9Abin31_0009 [Gammaproteobacteria bacterium]
MYTFELIARTPDMKLVQPAKDSLFAIPGRSTVASLRQTVFSRLYQFHILTFCSRLKVNGTAVILNINLQNSHSHYKQTAELYSTDEIYLLA